MTLHMTGRSGHTVVDDGGARIGKNGELQTAREAAAGRIDHLRPVHCEEML
ncbi:hypothetical protein [Mycobacterium hubeiense]|uniref:hypothetical protein n=1 Tax=Mycobacterium hubeiense TaxID=1867256 RepID=UPI00130465F7|nr:hypothetical protein [Mycobacterium sp. QGD 101]